MKYSPVVQRISPKDKSWVEIEIRFYPIDGAMADTITVTLSPDTAEELAQDINFELEGQSG